MSFVATKGFCFYAPKGKGMSLVRFAKGEVVDVKIVDRRKLVTKGFVTKVEEITNV